jgi:hypothetical protein
MITYRNNVTQAHFGRTTSIKTELKPDEATLAALKAAGMKYIPGAGWQKSCASAQEVAACSQAIKMAGGVLVISNDKSREEWATMIEKIQWTGPVAYDTENRYYRHIDKRFVVAESLAELDTELNRLHQLSRA